jgi:4-amino-4-deoxy-L-arabinose transferase-like glycosyltransferase
VLHAAETGRLRWLLLAAVIVGVGFNIKMRGSKLIHL